MVTPADIIWWTSEGVELRQDSNLHESFAHCLAFCRHTGLCRTRFLWRPPICTSTPAARRVGELRIRHVPAERTFARILGPQLRSLFYPSPARPLRLRYSGSRACRQVPFLATLVATDAALSA